VISMPMRRSRLRKAMAALAMHAVGGWTVDEKVGEFRRLRFDQAGNPHIDYVPFGSPEGRMLMQRWERL